MTPSGEFIDETSAKGMHTGAIRMIAKGSAQLSNSYQTIFARSIVNRLMKEVAPINSCVPAFPTAAAALAAVRARAESPGERRFLAPVVRPKCRRLQRDFRCAAHAPGSGRR
jgi:nitronate monooxygenase